MDKEDVLICNFIGNIIEMIEDAEEHNTGLQLRIYPEVIHALYSAFKAKNLT